MTPDDDRIQEQEAERLAAEPPDAPVAVDPTQAPATPSGTDPPSDGSESTPSAETTGSPDPVTEPPAEPEVAPV